jgi:hypothetical protein
MCDYQAQQKLSFEKHLNLKYSDVEHNCDQCDYITETKCLLRSHNETYHERIDTPVMCAIIKHNKNYPVKDIFI